MRLATGVLALALLAQAEAADPEVPVGQVLGSVACKEDPAQTYALYVPSGYTPARKWPVIFCFDPGARGRIPVERLQAAAEKYGYIVAGSNNSHNGPWAVSVDAMQAMSADVTARLEIDPARWYMAGMSGGARAATNFALAGLATGVIGCSAGFPMTPGEIPRKVPFLFFGTAGSEDFNRAELQRLDDELEERQAAHRVVYFDGGHDWAPAALLSEAVEWLEIQAMRTGARPKDEAMIQASLKARLAVAEAMAVGPGWHELKAIAADFKGLADTAEIERRVTAMASSPEVTEWQRAGREMMEREDRLTVRLRGLATDGSVAVIRRTAAEFRRQSEAAENTPERQMVRRAIGGVVIYCRESLGGLFEAHSYEKAALRLELIAAFRPGLPGPLFNLARAYALGGDKKGALEALSHAATAGFNNVAQTETEPAFVKLKREPAFQAALAKIRTNPVASTPAVPVEAH